MSDVVPISVRGNNTKAVQQELKAINLRFQALNADALVRILANIDVVHFLVSGLPARIKTRSTLFLTFAIFMRIPALFALIALRFWKTQEK